ncbi:MAG: exo-alpha-sialidase [Verrucomicrobia bacterium]|nr:exo-alpha-sialidase [Verrucomicrobiota bacterium]
MTNITPRTIATICLLSSFCAAQQTPAQKQDTTLAPPKNLKTKLAPGYTIPTVDISAEKHRQVIVDREAGQYLGHPTTVLLEDGRTMLIVYPKGHGRGAIVYKRSPDGGTTWSARLPTPESWVTSLEVPTLHRVVDAAGKKRIIMFSGLYPIRMAVTEDDGASWSELKPIGDFGGVVTMATVIDLKTGPGHYLAFFHDDGRFIRGGDEARYRVKGPHSDHTSPAAKPWRFWVLTTLSKDGGLTWSVPAPIAMLPDASLCEPGALRSPDGKQIAVLLRENSRKYNSFVIFSNDEGLTWTEPRELPAALTGDRHTAKYAPDGRLFISFRDTTHVSPTKGDWVGWVGTYDDIVKGNEGQYRVRIMDNTKGADCTYPGVELLPDGMIVTTTYGHWTEGELAYVVSVRFTLPELDAKAAAQKNLRP